MTTAHVGDVVTYTFMITNNGPDVASNVVFTDNLPAGLAYEGNFISVPPGISPAVSGNQITATVGSMDANTTVQLSFQADPGRGGSFGHQYRQRDDHVLRPTTPNNASVTISVSPSADLAISGISTTAAQNYVGSDLVYTITAVNNGLSNATGVTVIDTLPSLTDVTFVSAGTSVTGVTPTYDPSTGTVTADFGNLNAGATVTITITVTPTAAAVADSPLSDTAVISGNEYDPDHGNNTASVQNSIVASADLQVGITPSVSPVLAGQDDLYNHGDE